MGSVLDSSHLDNLLLLNPRDWKNSTNMDLLELATTCDAFSPFLQPIATIDRSLPRPTTLHHKIQSSTLLDIHGPEVWPFTRRGPQCLVLDFWIPQLVLARESQLDYDRRHCLPLNLVFSLGQRTLQGEAET